MAEAKTTLPTPIPTPMNVAALAKRHGVTPRTIQRRLAKGWTPAAKAPRRPRRIATQSVEALTLSLPNVATPDATSVTTPRPAGRGAGLVLVATAFAIAALAIVINAQTGMRFGTTPLAGITFAGLSVAADVLAIVLPSAAVALWWKGERGLGASAWAIWCLAAAMATLASVGFASLHISDTAAARAAIVTSAATATEQRTTAIQAATLAAQAATTARTAECQKRGPKCRDLEHAEQERMSELASAIAVPVPAAPVISDSDPQVTGAVRLASWAGVHLTPVDISNLRLAMMGLLPNLAGLVLAFGLALRRGRR